MLRVLIPALAMVAACGVPDDGPLMKPGDDCMQCHTTSPKAVEPAPAWNVAGTLYGSPDAKADHGLSLAEVLVTDKNGKQVTLRTSASGNFYSAEAFEFPIQVEVRKDGKSAKMQASPPVGSCNACHSAEPKNGAPGRIFLAK